MATNNKKPTHTLRCGNTKATIWQNEGEKGPFFATTFSRPFKDQSVVAWRNGTSFGLHDLEALMNVTLEAKEWIAAHVFELINRRSFQGGSSARIVSTALMNRSYNDSFLDKHPRDQSCHFGP